MIYIFHIFLGFIMGYFGLITPGMLNMTSVKYSIENGMREALIFSAGAAGIVFIQAMIALGFTDYLANHPEIIANLKIAGIIVFILLSVFFFIQAKKNVQIKNSKMKSKPFVTGIFMSSINMLAIPFYLALSAFLNARGHLTLSQPHITFFVIGAVLGAFSLFVTYAYFASYISKRIRFIARNINIILGFLFLFLAVLTFLKGLNS